MSASRRPASPGSAARARAPAWRVALDRTRRLRPEHVDRFERDGYLVLRRLVPPEVLPRLRQAVRRAMTVAGPTALERRENERGGERSAATRAFTQRVNLWRLDPLVRDVVLSRRLASVAAQLLRASRVRLYHDQALVKEPRSGPTPWHQDHVYWPLDGSALTIWIALARVEEDMGPLRFARGSHLQSDLGGGQISEESETRFDRLVRGARFEIEGPGTLAAGDATVHASWTLHRAGPNQSRRPRLAFTAIYFADGARVTAPGPSQRADLEAFLPELEPGDLAAGELTPLAGGEPRPSRSRTPQAGA